MLAMADDAVRPVVRDDVWDAVWDAVGRDVWDAVGLAVGAVGLAVVLPVWEAVGQPTRESLWAVLEARRGR
jgi:hypothetical protein